MLDEVKSALRIDGDDLDTEVEGLIDAVVADLILSGVSEVKAKSTTDPLIKRAVITYCRANFDYADKAAERLTQSYEMLKSHLSMSADYRAV